MNQAVLQPLSSGLDYPLQSDQECIEHLGAHASHASFAGNSLLGRADSIVVPTNVARYMQHRPATHDGQYQSASANSEGSSSISTSPDSISSFPPTNYQPSPILASPFPNANHLFPGSISYPQSFSGVSNTRQNIGTEHPAQGMLPPNRSPISGNPVSPSLSATARDNYTTSTPHLSSHIHHRHVLSPRNTLDSLPRTVYNPLSDTPRTGFSSTMALSPTSATSFSNVQSRVSGSYPTDTAGPQSPPFSSQDTQADIYCNGHSVAPDIHCKIEKGFFMSTDGNWTCYRRNYFSVTGSFTLTPHIPNERLYLQRQGKSSQEQIQAFAMSLSAAVDGASGKTIELVQHTPKRDKGPQNPIKKEKVAPTPPPKTTQDQSHGYSTLSSFSYPGATPTLALPHLPFQSEASDHQPTVFSSPHSSHQANTPPTSHTFERIQFKSATANNGKRRAQQQYYHLIVELWADVRTPATSQPNWIKVAQRVSAQVVVRGRSPSHYQNEGPHNPGGTRPSHGGAGASGGGSGIYGIPSAYGGSSAVARGMFTAPGGLNSSMYSQRASHYHMEPSPSHSHSMSSGSSVAGNTDGILSDAGMISSSSEDEGTRANYQYGYKYYPGALVYDTNPASMVKVESTVPDDERRAYHNSLQLGGCGPLQGMSSSRGFYPGASASYCT